MDNLIEIAQKEIGELTGESNSMSTVSKKTEIPQSAWRTFNNGNTGYGGGFKSGFRAGRGGMGGVNGQYDGNNSNGFNNQYHQNPKYGMGYNGKKYKTYFNADNSNNKYSDYMEFRKAMAKSEEDFLQRLPQYDPKEFAEKFRES